MPPILKMRLAIPLFFAAFLLHASLGHPQAHQLNTVLAGVCPNPPPTIGYGAAMGYFISAGATPDGEIRKLANKTCFNQDLDLSDQKTYSSSSPSATATTTYSYDVGRGRLKLQAEVKGSGKKTPIPISGGTYNANGRGGGNVIAWLHWVDVITLHSATAKPAPQNGQAIDPAQVVEINLKLLNNGKNVCTGGGGNYNYYKTSVALLAETTHKQVMGGQVNFDVNSDCTDQLNQGTIQVLLGLGQIRVDLSAKAEVGGYAQHGEGAQENVDVKVKLGEYQICYQVLKGPKDLKITSASGTDYTCPKK